MWPDSGKHVRAQDQPNPEKQYRCFLSPTHWKQITTSPPLSHHLHTLDRSLWSPLCECFFLFLYMSGEIDGALALTEGLPATPLTTQVICAWFLHQSRAATAHDGWPVMTRGGRRNHVIYNRVSQSTNEHATFRNCVNHERACSNWHRVHSNSSGSNQNRPTAKHTQATIISRSVQEILLWSNQQ